MAQIKILVVDDDEKILNLIQALLKPRGFEVFTMNRAQGVAEKIKKVIPQIILMDVMLPDLYGSDVVANLHKDPFIATIPVIFLTGLTSEKDAPGEPTSLKIGDRYFPAIAKPFDPEKLVNTVQKVLNAGKK